jgi:hypothetical protein
LIFLYIIYLQVEHANGVIKARFQSLKKIPIDIRFAAASVVIVVVIAVTLLTL